jgi:sec-independent protein translocase protein TatC
LKTEEGGSFWDHLEELRKKLFVVIGGISAATILSFIFSRDLMYVVLKNGPDTIQTLSPSEALVSHLQLSLISGLIISSPLTFMQFWRFIAPGLYDSERKTCIGATAASSILFAAGILFSWKIMLQPTVAIFQSFETGIITSGWSLANYIIFLGKFILVFGLAFQMPVAVVALVKLGIVTPESLAGFRRYVIVILMIVAAIMTPPDPMTQLMLALPLYLLFELSVLAARIWFRKE